METASNLLRQKPNFPKKYFDTKVFKEVVSSDCCLYPLRCILNILAVSFYLFWLLSRLNIQNLHSLEYEIAEGAFEKHLLDGIIYPRGAAKVAFLTLNPLNSSPL